MVDQPESDSSSDVVVSENRGEVDDVTENLSVPELSDVIDPRYLTPPSRRLEVAWEVPRHELPSLLRGVSPDRRGAAVNGESPLNVPLNRGGAQRSNRSFRRGGRPLGRIDPIPPPRWQTESITEELPELSAPPESSIDVTDYQIVENG